MAAKGYTTAAAVADFLGATFTAGQQTYAATLIEQAELYIDRETRRAWLTGARTNEVYYRDAFWLGNLYLRYAPVTSVASVAGRASLGDTEETLTADTDYEVRDLDSGLIALVYPGNYDRLRVTYTPVTTVPGPIAHAAAELVAAWMQPYLRPDTYGIDSVTLPDLSVRYAKPQEAAIPPSVQSALDLYRFRGHG